MLIFFITIQYVSTEGVFAIQLPPTARSINSFRRIDSRMSMKQIIRICGVPDKDVGSGIHIYVYNLSDGSLVRIGTPDNKRLIYVTHVLQNGDLHPIIKIPLGKRKLKRRVLSMGRPTNRWTRAAGACFSRCFFDLQLALPRQLCRWVFSLF